jgi:hypothetical protein
MLYNIPSFSYQSFCISLKYKPSIIVDVPIYTYHITINDTQNRAETFEKIFPLFLSKYIRNSKKLYRLDIDKKYVSLIKSSKLYKS